MQKDCNFPDGNTRVDVEFSYWLVTCNCLTKIYTDDFFGSNRFLSKDMASLLCLVEVHYFLL